jgi:methionine-rich copper-binding protein CopC
LRPALVAALFVGLLLALPGGAAGHALLQSSEPAAGSTLGSAPAAVTLEFGERPDPRLSSVKVLDTGGANHATGAAAAVEGKPESLRVAVGTLGDGVYTVAWRTV